MLTLARALVDYELDLLQIIASQWDIDLAASDRVAAADELATGMVAEGAAAATWGRLAEDEQKAIYDLQAHNGRLPYTHFIRRYGEIRPMGPARREREKPWLAPESVTEALFYRGLIVRIFEQSPAGAQEYIAIPGEMLTLLPQPPDGMVTIAPGYPVAPPRSVTADHLVAPDDITTELAYLRLRHANARDWLADIPVEVIDRHLRRPNFPACRAMLTALLYDLGLITDETLMTQIVTQVNRDSAQPWLEAPHMHQMRSLAEAWLNSLTWNDLAYTPGVEADRWPNDPRLARQAVLNALKEVPAEIWWSLDSLVEYLKQTDPDFQRPGGDYGGWYLRDAYSGEIMHGFQFWDSIEGALIRFIIEGPMRWLGLLRVSRGAFLLTPIGLALMGRAEWLSTPDVPAKIKVDEQGVISVPVELSRYERLRIARFAAWISAPLPRTQPGNKAYVFVNGEDDGVYEYRLTPQAMTRVAGDGIDVQKIIAFLQRLSGQSLPPNVVKMLEAWAERPDEVVVQDVVIITAKDLSVYERLRKHDRVNRWLGEAVGPRSHAVKREDFPQLLNALRQLGILPLFEGHEKDNWP